jgi:hypothetical protein
MSLLKLYDSAKLQPSKVKCGCVCVESQQGSARTIFVVRRDAAKTAKFVQRMRLESRAKECVDGSQSLTRNENGLFVGREDVRIEE